MWSVTDLKGHLINQNMDFHAPALPEYYGCPASMNSCFLFQQKHKQLVSQKFSLYLGILVASVVREPSGCCWVISPSFHSPALQTIFIRYN